MIFQDVQIQHTVVAGRNADGIQAPPGQIVGTVLEFGEEHRVAAVGPQVELPPQLVDGGRRIARDAEQRVVRIGIDEIEDGLPRGGEDFRRPAGVGPAAAMHAAVGRRGIRSTFSCTISKGRVVAAASASR